MKITKYPEIDKALSDYLEKIPDVFAIAGEVLHKGRNEIRLVTVPGSNRQVVAKKFAKPDIFKKISAAMHGTKCIRAFNNAKTLTERGIRTPLALAAIEDANGVDYLVTEVDDGAALCEFDCFTMESLPALLAEFSYRMHKNGIIHRDYNNTNIRVLSPEEHPEISVIDINRMTIYPTGEMPSYNCRMAMLRKFSYCDEMFKRTLREYLNLSGEYTEKEYARQLKLKQRHDNAYARKKRITGTLKRILGLNRK